MRMRKLGKGQSVVFCIPDEIRIRITQQRTDREASDPIEVSDVLVWAVSETHQDLKRSVALWATQGLRFYRHEKLWEVQQTSQNEASRGWAKDFLEDEAKSLEQRYKPSTSNTSVLHEAADTDPTIRDMVLNHCKDFGPAEFSVASLQEEQEREIAPEREAERQMESPPVAQPATHSILEDVRYYIHTGRIPRSSAFIPAFASLNNTRAAAFMDTQEFSEDLLVTKDFARTVIFESEQAAHMDYFQRPVQWVLTSTKERNRAVMISGFEAQALLSDIRDSKYVTLHLYAPRMNLAHDPLDDLALYTVPERESRDFLPRATVNLLNLFAGQLYMRSFEEYTEVCKTLGLASIPYEGDSSLEPDGFIPPHCRLGVFAQHSTFSRSPTKFIQILMGMRRNNLGIDKTHLGKILSGTLLDERDFEE